MAAEELARGADDADAAVQERRRQVWADAVAVLALVEVHDAAEEGRDKRCPDNRAAVVDPAGKPEVILLDLQRRLGRDRAADRLRQGERLPAERRAKLLRPPVLAWVGR